MLEKLIAILNELCGADEGEIQPDTALFDEGILDSFGLVSLIVEIEKAFGVSLDPAALSREDVATPEKIAARIHAG